MTKDEGRTWQAGETPALPEWVYAAPRHMKKRRSSFVLRRLFRPAVSGEGTVKGISPLFCVRHTLGAMVYWRGKGLRGAMIVALVGAM
jgi:hypothetical protein